MTRCGTTREGLRRQAERLDAVMRMVTSLQHVAVAWVPVH